MTRIMSSGVEGSVSPQSIPAPPAWLGEAALLVRHLGQNQGVLDAISGAGALCSPPLWGTSRSSILWLSSLDTRSAANERFEAFYERAAALGQRLHGAFRA